MTECDRMSIVTNLGFWGKIEKPVIALAPLANVTDAAFRRIIAKYSRMGAPDGGPDVLWTEFVSADGLVLADPKGKQKLLFDLIFSESERPIVAQIFGGNLSTIEKAANIAAGMGFNGLDINMGCPDRAVEKQCAGAALIKNPKLAREIIRSAKKGIDASGKKIPLSVKTRIGYGKNELDNWLPELLSEEPAVITIHARTRKEMSLVPARWDSIKRAVEIRNNAESKTLIFGNGDVFDVASAVQKAKETGCDGVMLGRAIFGNPFLFAPHKYYEDKTESEKIKMKLSVAVEHAKLFEELLSGVKNFSIMKKHFKAYSSGFTGAKELRLKLMETQNANQVKDAIYDFLKNFIK